MKQVFCDTDMATEEKSVEIRVRFADETGFGLRRHFCTERGRVVRVDVRRTRTASSWDISGKCALYRLRGEWFRYVPEIVEHFGNR